MLIDTQLHLIDPLRFPFDDTGAGYIPGDDESGDLETLLSTLAENGVDRGVLVQPSAYGLNNSALLDALTREGDRLRAIVMQEDVEAPSEAGVSGVRLNLTDYARHNLQSALSIGNSVLSQGMILQVQARPSELAELLPHLPDGPVIIDHLGRPNPERSADISAILTLADRPNTWLKVSGGFRLEVNWRKPSPTLGSLVAEWPAAQVIWGSDWPFLNIDRRRPTYDEVLQSCAELTDLRAASANAARLFGWQNG